MWRRLQHPIDACFSRGRAGWQAHIPTPPPVGFLEVDQKGAPTAAPSSSKAAAPAGVRTHPEAPRTRAPTARGPREANGLARKSFGRLADETRSARGSPPQSFDLNVQTETTIGTSRIALVRKILI
jgi:hypothetical protein